MVKADIVKVLLVVGLSTLSGCMMYMRDPDYYAEGVGELLESRNEAIAACYDRYLEQQDPKARGELVVEFDVQKRTGALENIAVDEGQTTVPPELAACVTDEVADLKFAPADAKTAHATFTWQFAPGSRKRPPADPFAGVQDGVLACYSQHLSAVDRAAQGALVIDYAFDRETGKIERLDVIADSTTAPAPVVECATAVLRGATIDREQLEDRNIAGRRTFTLRFEPYEAPR